MNCLHTIAEFLAGEMDHDLQTALNKSTESYQAELGANRCTLEQARVLRFLTCSASQNFATRRCRRRARSAS